MHTCKWFSLLLLFCLFNCGKPLPTLEGIDLARWKADANGCRGFRAGMADAVAREKNKLLALDEVQMVSLLGPPDQNELYKRNQKFFYYFLSPAPACGGTTDPLAAQLVIRFNAMGLAKEVAIE